MNLAFASERMAQAFLEGQQDGLETDKLNMMNDFIADCQALLQGQAPEGAPPTEAPAGPPADMMAALSGAPAPAPGPEGPPMGIPAGLPPVPTETPEPLPA